MKITINQNENQNIGISNRNTQDILVNDNDIQTLKVESNTPQTLGINQNENQVILISGGGEIIGITDVLVNGVTVVSGNIAYITVPTKTSELQNNSGFITSETDPTVPSYIKEITLADINNWNSKQNALVSGSTIKTVNNENLLGSGNIEIEGTLYNAGIGISIENNTINNEITSYNDLNDLPTIPTKTSELINDNDFVSEEDLAEVAFTGSYNSLSDTPIIPSNTSELINDSDFITSVEVSTELATKQDTLVSGTNIKTINNESLLGSGNIQIEQTYSSTETKIGKWIDGRDLYRKVITFTFINANQWNNVAHNIVNLYEVVSLKSTMYYSLNGNFYAIPNDIVIETRIDSTNFGYYFTNSNFSYNATGNAIIEYTK